MTRTNSPLPSTRLGRTLASLLLAGAAVTACDPTPVPPKDGPELVYVRACDPSVCLYAYEVVDSDGDGVSDADELAAGTDPFDASSRPDLGVVLELAAGRKLPSFEAGLGFVLVFPVEIQAMLEEVRDRPVVPALPATPERADALTRAGISTSTLSQHGIDASRDGFTLGLEPATHDDQVPEARVGGIRVSHISADDELAPLPELPYGGVKKVEHVMGDTLTTYNDGTVKAEWGSGGFTYMDKNGTVIYDSSFVNPDADDPSADPTAEQLEAWKRMHQSAVRTVEGWSLVPIDEVPEGDEETLILVDLDLAAGYMTVSDLPRVTTTQPEGRPDLPNPQADGNGLPGSSCGLRGCGGQH